MLKYVYITLLLLALKANVFAQCVDPNIVSPNYPCPDPSYKPVCGCDNNTYRNLCDARYKNGVLYYTDGPCSGFEFDILPTFADNTIAPRITFVQNTGLPAQFVVTDFWGKIILQRTLPSNDNITNPFIFDLNEALSWRPGTYILLVYNSQGTYRFKKFVKF